MGMTLIEPEHILGMTTMSVDFLVKLMLESRGIISPEILETGDTIKTFIVEPSEDEIENMCEAANNEKETDNVFF